MADAWYYAKGPNQLGPVTFEQLRQMAAGGQLAGGDLVWTEGQAQWSPAANVPGLTFVATAAAPQMMSPPPPQYGYPPPVTPYGVVTPNDGSGKATAALVLGICSMFLWFCPIIGLPVSITGLVLGMRARAAGARGAATWGMWLSAVGLALSLLNAAWGAYMVVNNQHPIVAPGGGLR
jgi:hypothetical protein